MNLITTVIGFGMSATFIVFVCTRIICGRIRGAESRQMFEMESRIDLEQPEHRDSGLEPVLVAAIPTLRFTQEAFSSAADAQCSICLEEYQEKEELRIMPGCGHNFHLSCRCMAKKTVYMPGLSVPRTRIFSAMAAAQLSEFSGEPQ